MNRLYRPRSLAWGAGLSLLAISAAGASLAFNRSHASDPPTNAEPRPAGVVCFGHVDLEHGVTSLYPLIPGRVVAVEARENEPVKAGAVLVRLDDRVARLRVKEARADVEAAREQLAQARQLPEQHRAKLAQQQAAIDAVRHRLDAARQFLARKRELEQIQQINVREVDAVAAQVLEMEATERAEASKRQELQLVDPASTIRRAQADVEAKQARQEQAERAQDECLLRAPTDGSALRVLVGPGDVLGPQPKQAAILFCQHSQRLIRAEVEQEFAGRVAAGQAAAIQDDVTAGPTWRGKVIRVSDWFTHRRSVMQEPFQFNDVRTLECLVALDPGQPPLRIGQRVRVTISPPAP